MEIPDIKPNSFKYKNEQKQKAAERERLSKVVKGEVKTRKGTLSKLTSGIISDSAGNVGDHIRDEVLIPAVKDTILDIIIKGATIIFGGGRSTRKDSPLSKVSYINYGDRFSSPYNSYSQKPETYSSSIFNYDNLVYSSRADAELVLDQMYGAIKKYGMVTVMDLYDMVEKTAPYTSDKYGWTNVDSATVERVYGGYVIRLPKAMPID